MFVALTPDAEALDELAEFLAPRLAARTPTLRFVDRAQWHVTLAFLPDVPPRRLDDLQDRLARAALRRNDFALAVDRWRGVSRTSRRAGCCTAGWTCRTSRSWAGWRPGCERPPAAPGPVRTAAVSART